MLEWPARELLFIGGVEIYCTFDAATLGRMFRISWMGAQSAVLQPRHGPPREAMGARVTRECS